MILVLDVGNTNITFGVYEGKELVTTFRITTKISRTSDEYGILIRDLLHMNDINRADIEGSIVASSVLLLQYQVVRCMNLIKRLIQRLFRLNLLLRLSSVLLHQ